MERPRPWTVVFEVPQRELSLGARRFDIAHRALVMGVLDHGPGSCSDGGTRLALGPLLAEAAQLVDDGADLLGVGGVPAEPGAEVGEQEELERVVPAVEALHERFDLPISVDTWRASVLREALTAGAVVGNDISGFADPAYLPTAAEAGASVVASHGGFGRQIAVPGSGGDEPVVDAVGRALRDRAERAEAAGIPRERVMVDAGLDLGKTEAQSLELLRSHDQLAGLGWPLLLSACHKRFLGAVAGADATDLREATHAAHALGIALGSRILRAHDVRGARRTADVMAAVLASRARGIEQ